jgi:uncharacterized protein YjdB
MRKAGKLFIGALSVGALVGTGYAAWTVNYGGATKVDKEVNPVFDTELVINGAGLVVTDKETELNFTEEADADFEISYYVSPSNTNWYDHIYADDAAVDINVTVSGVNNKADDSWKEYIVAPTAEIGYEDWLGADAKAAGKYEVNLTFAWKEAKPSERWASLTPAEQEVNYRAMLEAVAGLKFVVTFELYSMPRVVTSVTLDKQLLELSDRDNKTGKLVATVLPEKAADKSLTWTSENEQVATVDQEGNVTAVGVGETVIKATSVNNIVASATVRVTHDVLPISFVGEGNLDLVEINATYLTDDAGWQQADLKAEDLSYLIGKQLNLNVQPIENHVLDSVTVIATRGDEEPYDKELEITPNGASYQFTVEEGFAHKIVVEAHKHGTIEGDPLSVAEAIEIATKQGSTASTDEYYAKGFVTSVVTAYSSQYGNITFNFADTADGTDFVQAYRLKTTAELAEKIKAGAEVMVKGKLKKFNSTLEFDSGCELVKIIAEAPEIVDNTNYGTAAEPLTISELIQEASSLAQGATSNQIFYATGVLKNNPSGNNNKFDLTDGQNEFMVYSSDITTAYQNDTIVISGYVKNYSGTLEFVNNGDVKTTLVGEPVRGSSTIEKTIDAEQGSTDLVASATNMETVEFTVTPEEGYVVEAVKVDGTAIPADDEGKYSFTVKGNMKVAITFKSSSATDNEVQRNYAYTFSASALGTSAGNVTLGNLTFAQSALTYTGWNSSAQQIGSKNKPQTDLGTLTLQLPAGVKVSDVGLVFGAASSGEAYFKVETKNSSDEKTSNTGISSATETKFAISDSVDSEYLIISFKTNVSGKAIYLKTINIEFTLLDSNEFLK